MEYRKIENLVYKQNLLDRYLFKNNKEYNLKLDKMLIENLQKCIDNNIPLDINEEEMCKVYKIYIKLIQNNYKIDTKFISNLCDLSTKKLDYLGLIHEITE